MNGGRFMKKFRELHIAGLDGHVDEFVNLANSACANEWKCTKENIMGIEYIVFEYYGNRYPKAKVFIASLNGNVGNIVPLEKGQLTIIEYNDILENLYDKVLSSLGNGINGVVVGQLGADECDLKEIFGVETLQKLKVFCQMANRGSGSADPNDRKLWFDFVRCAYREKGELDTYYLRRVLIEEFGWSYRLADELISEYFLLTDYMTYCSEGS